MNSSSKSLKFLALAFSIITLSGCSSTTIAKDWNGVGSPDGQVLGHVSTSNIAIHLLGKKPLSGDATLETTVSDFTLAAKGLNASKVRIVQSNQFKWWFILPPFSIFITPVTSNVAGEAIA